MKQGSIDQGFDFLECENTEALVQSTIRGKLEACIKDSGFTFVGSVFHKFKGGVGEGYSFLAIIGESHVAIHTWPEKQAVEVSLHYCNFSRDNGDKAEKLISLYKEIFRPAHVSLYKTRIRCVVETLQPWNKKIQTIKKKSLV
ncbi:MAG: S-adenosylmethionine decarboxylase [Parcubacteria group bacterium]|nr:S-adenosylmethionine decarboxylase [Parcubacteria group bacterium]